MNILWHMPTLQRAGCGLSRRALRMAIELERRGHRVTFAVAGDKTDVADARIEEFPLLRIPIARRRPLHWSMQAMARRDDAGLVVTTLPNACDVFISCQPEMVSAWKLYHPGRPTVFVCGGTTLLHNFADAERQVRRRWTGRVPFWVDRQFKHVAERKAFSTADLTILNSRHTRDRIIETYGAPAARCHTVYGGCDPDQLAPADPAQRSAARKALGLSPDGVVIAWSGRIAREKHVEHLIRAARECGQPLGAVLLAGDGPLRADTAQSAEECGMADRVRFLGRLVDVRICLHAADVFAFPSIGESFGNALVEAMACGLPCVGLRADGVRVCNANDEIIDDGRTGLLVDGLDPKAFARAIDRLAADPALRARMGRAGRDKAVRLFNWASAGEQYATLIAALTKAKAGPGRPQARAAPTKGIPIEGAH